MREQQIHGIVGRIRDDLVLEAEPRRLAALYREAETSAKTETVKGGVILSEPIGVPKKPKKRFKKWLPMVVAAAVAVTVGLNVWPISGMNDLIGQGGLTPPSGTPSGNPFGDLFGSLFPFLSPETETPHEVTVRDPEESTEPEDSTESEDTRTECQKGNHEWEITDYENATCYLVSPVTYTCTLCGDTKRASDYRPHTYAEGFCTVCGMPEGAWMEVEYTMDSTNPDYLCISKVKGNPEGKLVLPNHFYDPSVDRFIPVTEIGEAALFNLDKITEVVIPNTVIRIERSAFAGCLELERVNFPEGLEAIGDLAFTNCAALTEAHLPDSVIELGAYVFEDCTSLVTASLPVGIHTIPSGIYSGCYNLTEVICRGSITQVNGGAFEGCFSLTELPDMRDLKKLGSGAFGSCSSLKVLPAMPKLEEIGSHAFTNCVNLTEVTLPATLRDLGAEAFSYCYALKKVTIEASSLNSIGTRVFWECSSLREITLPETVDNFSGEEMFGECKNLTIYYSGTQEQWQTSYISRKLYLPDNTKVVYTVEEAAE